jgi:hypothetical protein
VGWIHLAQDRDVTGSCKNGNETSGSIKCRNCLTSSATPGFSTGTKLHEVIFLETLTNDKEPAGYLGKMYKSQHTEKGETALGMQRVN